MGGRVKSDMTGKTKVFVSQEDPGLHIARSIGDYQHHLAGVVAEPDLSEYMIQVNDQIIVLASMGIWDTLSNERVGLIAHTFYETMQAEAAANAIL